MGPGGGVGWGVLLLFIVHMFLEDAVIRSFINKKRVASAFSSAQQSRTRYEVILIGQEHCRDKKEFVCLIRLTDSRN